MRSDGPLLLSTGSGMVTGLALWVVGIWGPGGPELLKDAALPPPYTAAFFRERLVEWVTSMQPAITFPLILLAIVATVLVSRRTRTPAPQYEQVSIWWISSASGGGSAGFSSRSGGGSSVPNAISMAIVLGPSKGSPLSCVDIEAALMASES